MRVPWTCSFLNILERACVNVVGPQPLIDSYAVLVGYSWWGVKALRARRSPLSSALLGQVAPLAKPKGSASCPPTKSLDRLQTGELER